MPWPMHDSFFQLLKEYQTCFTGLVPGATQGDTIKVYQNVLLLTVSFDPLYYLAFCNKYPKWPIYEKKGVT